MPMKNRFGAMAQRESCLGSFGGGVGVYFSLTKRVVMGKKGLGECYL